MIMAYGTRPTITNLRVDPPLFAPAAGTQTASFTFSTYLNAPATVTVEFMNQDSLSKLRTITQNNVSPGNFTIGWDGRAYNGMWVAPGNYTVIVKVTDSMGNAVVESRILSTIQY
jgi:flagellar hook assembly protein FlgD